MTHERLFELLKAYRSSKTTFNQYQCVHPGLDRPTGAAARRQNLRAYLRTFAEARFVLVGEAAGYAGCRFSGIPFTCEAQITTVSPLEARSRKLSWTLGLALVRSSTAERPWVERSATTVWDALGERMDCVLWNAFPWHPFCESNPLSNRPPGRDMHDGLEVLNCLLSLFPDAQPVAIGRVAQRALGAIGVEATYVRHPSRGGKHKFLAGLAALKPEPAFSIESPGDCERRAKVSCTA